MSRYNKIPEGYTIEKIERQLPFLKNAKIEDVKIKINKNNKLYWNYGKFYNGTFKNSYWGWGNFYNEKFINSYWRIGWFHNGKFINSYWDDGWFYNGTFINSYWNDGEFYNKTFKNSYWRNGYIFNGYFFNSIIKKIYKNNEFEDYSKAKFYNCIILEPKLLKSDRTYSKLTFKGIK